MGLGLGMPAAPDEGLGRAKHYMKRFKSKRRTVTYAREATGRNPADFHPAPLCHGPQAPAHRATRARRRSGGARTMTMQRATAF